MLLRNWWNSHPNKRVQAIITADLNLDPDDPLIEAAEQLSDPETPNISERFNVKDNVKKEAKEKLKEQKEKRAQEERIRMEQEHLAITKLMVCDNIKINRCIGNRSKSIRWRRGW